MKVSEKIQLQINKIPEETTFGYEQLGITKSEFQAGTKVIERLLKKGFISKLSKGVFYKPGKSVFGDLKPSDTELIRNYLYEGGKRIAYITGVSLYNQLGLTTQMAFRIKIASRVKRIYINTKAIKATPVKSYAEVTEDNYKILGFLDAIKDIKIIPDTPINTIISMLSSRIKELDNITKNKLVSYSLLYPARVRALLGAILERLDYVDINVLKESLNPLTKYKLGVNKNRLETAQNWNIE